MSELINNREYRQKVLKELVTDLHNGKSVDEVKARFEKLIEGISPSEISEMEQALIQEGMPIEEVQRLCDVHAALFEGSIETIHQPQGSDNMPGHPIHTFRLENRELEKLMNDKILPTLEDLRSTESVENINKLKEAFAKLWEIDKHYSRKENLLFPIMEKHNITAPPKVMWGVDDEIRDTIKEARKVLEASGMKEVIYEKGKHCVERVKEMISKEENILFPMVLETFTEEEWGQIAEAGDEIGYCLTKPAGTWRSSTPNNDISQLNKSLAHNGYIQFDAGELTPEEINSILNTLPLDITYVDKTKTVKYVTQGKERIFARPKTVLGRQVENCHPPESVHVVEKIVEELQSGKKDHEDFWIRMGDMYVHIRYFAVRNSQGEFLGIMEITQDIKPLQAITGEKRLLAESE